MADQALTTRISEILGADESTLRDELLWMAFESLTDAPLAGLLADPELVPAIVAFLNEENARRIAKTHVLPAIERGNVRIADAEDRVRDALPSDFEAKIVTLISTAQGPRFPWLKGMIDPSDLKELLGPVVQQVLVQFTTKLPLPGLSGSSAAASASAITGLVGMFGKQVQKSARELADVGKSVMGGLSGELERRMQTLARDFSQTAMVEFKNAIIERLQSDEGKKILERMRARAVTHVLDTRLKEVVSDLSTAPMYEMADLIPKALHHTREQTLFQALLSQEIEALLGTLGQRSVSDLLREAGLYEQTRDITLRMVDPGAVSLFRSDRFKDWLGRLLDAGAEK